MIVIELKVEDLASASSRVSNLAGTFFAGTSPLIRPFLVTLQEVLPEENRGLGMAYSQAALRNYVDLLHVDGEMLRIECQGRSVQVSREQLSELWRSKYPGCGHDELNLAGLLFLQSGPALQLASIIKLRREHGIRIPEGRRTQRYIFHHTVMALEADRKAVHLSFDMVRLPRSLEI